MGHEGTKYDEDRRPNCKCPIFDLDDTLYPVASGIGLNVMKNIENMVEKLGIDKKSAWSSASSSTNSMEPPWPVCGPLGTNSTTMISAALFMEGWPTKCSSLLPLPCSYL